VAERGVVIMELQIAALVGGGLLLIVLLSPGADHGRRPMYYAVGLDRHRKPATRRARTAGNLVMTGASDLTPAEALPTGGGPRTVGEIRADQLVAGMLTGARR
jgi:hypothetical protein